MNQQCNLSFKTGLMYLLVKVVYNLIARTVENFRIACRFLQSNNEFFMRHLYLLSFINKNKTFCDSNTILKQKCNIAKSGKYKSKFFFKKFKCCGLFQVSILTEYCCVLLCSINVDHDNLCLAG